MVFLVADITPKWSDLFQSLIPLRTCSRLSLVLDEQVILAIEHLGKPAKDRPLDLRDPDLTSQFPERSDAAIGNPAGQRSGRKSSGRDRRSSAKPWLVTQRAVR